MLLLEDMMSWRTSQVDSTLNRSRNFDVEKKNPEKLMNTSTFVCQRFLAFLQRIDEFSMNVDVFQLQRVRNGDQTFVSLLSRVQCPEHGK